jgi:transposase
MEISKEQYQRIQTFLPRQRGHVTITNQTLLNALVYRCENGCKWRSLPKTFGHWHTIYMRLNRWAKSGVLERVFCALQEERLVRMKTFSLGSTSIKVHPDAHGALKKGENKR